VRLQYVYPYPHVDEVIGLMTEGKVLPYLDIPFQHASPEVLKAMKRPAAQEKTLARIKSWRAQCPELALRSTFIVGFPGETAEDLRELELFLNEARLDAIGIFGYSDEDGTEAAGFAEEDKLPQDEVDRRMREFHDLADELMAQRAEDRIGETVEVLIETATDGEYEGRAAHQGPDDGSTTVLADRPLAPGDLVTARVVESLGADLVARA
jgi:ribosomal protein S12 methylthiotransferase